MGAGFDCARDEDFAFVLGADLTCSVDLSCACFLGANFVCASDARLSVPLHTGFVSFADADLARALGLSLLVCCGGAEELAREAFATARGLGLSNSLPQFLAACFAVILLMGTCYLLTCS